MRLIDTHCHLDSEQFDDDLDQVIQKSKDAGVERIYLPNVDVQGIPKMLGIADKYPDFVFPMLGIHPTDITLNYKEDLAVIHESLCKRKFAAVGEIGVDLYHDKSLLKEQMDAFEMQINMALEFDLPINIHVREAFNEAFEVLESFPRNTIRGVFHCFSGSKEIAERVFRLGNFYLGIGGVVTFKNAKLPEVIKTVGLERIVLETDAPFLAPTPHRGKRNDSSYLVDVATFIGDTLGLSPDFVAEQTSLNSQKLYNYA